MSKHIDAEKMKAEIRRIVEEETLISKGADYYHGVADTADKLLSFITSLQQEQPEIKSYIEKLLKGCVDDPGEYYRGRRETLAHLFYYLGGNPLEYLRFIKQPEVDLDAEIAIYLNRNVLNRINNSDIIEDFTTMEAGELARYFYEIGLNARKK